MEIMINQDVRKFKTKDIGAFSFAQVGWALIAGGLGYGTYYLEKKYLGTYQLETCVIPAAIPIILGFFEPQGMSCFKYIQMILIPKLFAPKNYRWQSDFVYQMDEFGSIYGEEYAIDDERASVINEVEHPSEGKLSKAEQKAIQKAIKESAKLAIK